VTALENDMKKVSKESWAWVNKELTEGEKVLWIGAPEAEAKGRGFFGAMRGAEQRSEPAYVLFAITNRRAIVWVRDHAAMSYYSPHLTNLGIEDDKRVPNGGNILFKVVKVVTTTTNNKGHTSTSTVMHYFGFLHIRNYKHVGRLLYETLVEPLAD
jgi:hypothetical protein